MTGNEWAKDRGDWHCNDQSFKSLEDALAARREGEHIWRDTYIGHSTRGPVCKVCNVDSLCGMSVFGCPGKRLWDSHWIPKTSADQPEKWVKFKAPSEVTTHFEYEHRDNMVLRRCIGGKMTVTRDGAIIAEYDFLPDPPLDPDRFKVISLGQMIPSIREDLDKFKDRGGDRIQRMHSLRGEDKTPFLDLLRSNAIKPVVEDFKLPPRRKIEYLPEEI